MIIIVKYQRTILISTFVLGSRPIISGAPSPRQLSRQGSSIESSTVHTHTVECAGSSHARLHQPVTSHSRGSPTSNECDFHCCSLHAAGHTSGHSTGHSTGHSSSNHGTNSHKTVATSPVQVGHIATYFQSNKQGKV